MNEEGHWYLLRLELSTSHTLLSRALQSFPFQMRQLRLRATTSCVMYPWSLLISQKHQDPHPGLTPRLASLHILLLTGYTGGIISNHGQSLACNLIALRAHIQIKQKKVWKAAFLKNKMYVRVLHILERHTYFKKWEMKLHKSSLFPQLQLTKKYLPLLRKACTLWT